jgi:hypothetical protein
VLGGHHVLNVQDAHNLLILEGVITEILEEGLGNPAGPAAHHTGQHVQAADAPGNKEHHSGDGGMIIPLTKTTAREQEVNVVAAHAFVLVAL